MFDRETSFGRAIGDRVAVSAITVLGPDSVDLEFWQVNVRVVHDGGLAEPGDVNDFGDVGIW